MHTDRVHVQQNYVQTRQTSVDFKKSYKIEKRYEAIINLTIQSTTCIGMTSSTFEPTGLLTMNLPSRRTTWRLGSNWWNYNTDRFRYDVLGEPFLSHLNIIFRTRPSRICLAFFRLKIYFKWNKEFGNFAGIANLPYNSDVYEHHCLDSAFLSLAVLKQGLKDRWTGGSDVNSTLLKFKNGSLSLIGSSSIIFW